MKSMACEAIEIRILDYLENQLSVADRQEVETHLAGCADCRTFARQLQLLDTALSGGVKAPALSADFEQRLEKRIRGVSGFLSETERAERKRALEAEFEAGQARIGRGTFGFEALLRRLTWPVLAAVSGWLAWRITLALTAHVTAQTLDGLDPHLLPWLVAGIVCLAVGLAELLPRVEA